MPRPFPDRAVATLQSGIGHLVADSKIPVVPCHLEGCFHSWPPGGRFPKPTRLSIRIGKPVTFEDCPDDRTGWNTVAERLHGCVEDLSR